MLTTFTWSQAWRIGGLQGIFVDNWEKEHMVRERAAYVEDMVDSDLVAYTWAIS